MPAPAKNFTVIAATAVDVDSPIDEALMTALADRDEHLEEWLGKNYTAAVDHDHDGVNSKLIPISPLKVLDASSSATIEFVNGVSGVVFDGTYDTYIIDVLNAFGSVDAQNLLVEVGTGAGPTWLTTGYRCRGTGEAVKTSFALNDSNTGNEVSNNLSSEGISGRILIWKPTSSKYKHFWSYAVYTNTGDIAFWNDSGWLQETTSALTGVRFKFSSGDISSGRFKLYGIP